MPKPFPRRTLTVAVVAAAAFAIACGNQPGRSADTHASHEQPVQSAAAPVAAASAAVPGLPATLTTMASAAAVRTDVVFSGKRDETERFIAYYQSIHLTPEQERVKVEALAAIPAPCCSNNPLATCCCPCNMAKAAWGLSAWLITEKGYGVAQVQQAARDWLAAANPRGFSGDSCYSGGCTRPIRENGCGGMDQGKVL